MIDYAAGGDLLDAYGAAWQTSMAMAGSGSSPRMPSTMRTRSARRSSAITRFGHTCCTQPTSKRDVDFTVERHWVSGYTLLAAWHASWVVRARTASTFGSPGS